MLSFEIKQQLKSTVSDLAMQGLQRLAYGFIDRNPYARMHQISKGVFSAIDHKQMLASVVVKQLVDANKVTKYKPIKYDKYGMMFDQVGNPIRHEHYVYVTNSSRL